MKKYKNWDINISILCQELGNFELRIWFTNLIKLGPKVLQIRTGSISNSVVIVFSLSVHFHSVCSFSLYSVKVQPIGLIKIFLILVPMQLFWSSEPCNLVSPWIRMLFIMISARVTVAINTQDFTESEVLGSLSVGSNKWSIVFKVLIRIC